jgi:hypothetical protein
MNPEKDDKGNVTDYWYSFDPTPYSKDNNELLGDGYTYAINAPTPIITSYMK